MKQLMTIALLLLTVVASAQIPINTNFQVSTPNPIDGRMTIATLSDTSTITDLYDGLLTVVQDTDEIWQYDGTQWVQFSGVGTDDQTAAVVKLPPYKFPAPTDVVNALPLIDSSSYLKGSNFQLRLYNGDYGGFTDEAVHPSIIYTPHRDWKFWMVVSSYPDRDAEHENTCVMVSNDLVSWQEPENYDNPLTGPPNPGVTSDFHADPVIIEHNDSMYVFWTATADAKNGYQIVYKRSIDGSNWSQLDTLKEQYGSIYNAYASPAFVMEKDSTWTMYGTRLSGPGGTAYCGVFKSNSLLGDYAIQDTVTINGGDMQIWHQEIRRYGDYYIGVFNRWSQGDVIIGISTDGIDFYSTTNPVLAPFQPGFDPISPYKSCVFFVEGLPYIAYSTVTGDDPRVGIEPLRVSNAPTGLRAESGSVMFKNGLGAVEADTNRLVVTDNRLASTFGELRLDEFHLNIQSKKNFGIRLRNNNPSNASMVLIGSGDNFFFQKSPIAGNVRFTGTTTGTPIDGTYFFNSDNDVKLVIDRFAIPQTNGTLQILSNSASIMLQPPGKSGDNLAGLINFPPSETAPFTKLGYHDGGVRRTLVSIPDSVSIPLETRVPVYAPGFTGGERWTVSRALSLQDDRMIMQTGFIDSKDGYRVNNTAPSGEYLRGNGTNFVSSAIQESDLPTRPATDVTVTDAGGYFTGTDMEAVTQEIGADLYTQSNLRNLLGIEIGNASGTPDVNGNITVTHSLGVTPTVVLVTGTTTNTIPNSDKHIVSVVEKNTTNFVVRIWDETGSPATGTVTFDWQAIE